MLAKPVQVILDSSPVSFYFGLELGEQPEMANCFNIHFEADFMAIRAILDPHGKVSPKLFEQVFFDKFFLLTTRGDFYSQYTPEVAGELQDDSASSEESFKSHLIEHQIRRKSDNGDNCALGFCEFSDKDEINAYLKSQYAEQGIHSTADLSHVVARFHVLRWEKILGDDIVLQLDSALLQSGMFCDVGTLRLRCATTPTNEFIRSCLEGIIELQQVRFELVTTPSKFLVAIGALKNRSIGVHENSKIATAHTTMESCATTSARIKLASPQWLLWSIESSEEEGEEWI